MSVVRTLLLFAALAGCAPPPPALPPPAPVAPQTLPAPGPWPERRAPTPDEPVLPPEIPLAPALPAPEPTPLPVAPPPAPPPPSAPPVRPSPAPRAQAPLRAPPPEVYACEADADCVISCDLPGGWCLDQCGCRTAVNRHVLAELRRVPWAERTAADACPAVGCAWEPAMFARCVEGRCRAAAAAW